MLFLIVKFTINPYKLYIIFKSRIVLVKHLTGPLEGFSTIGDLDRPRKVDAVYVLSEKGFHDRIVQSVRELQRHCIEFEFIFDFDCDTLGSEVLSAFGDCNLGLPHKALVLKHLQAWRLACKHRHGRILVFEDDVLLRRRFQRLLSEALSATEKLEAGWLVFLGGADTKVPDRFFSEPGPLISMPIATAEGYVTDLVACERRLSWCEQHAIALPADALIRHIDATMGVRQYWLARPAVEQGSVTGRFASKLDGHRMKHSRWVNIARNRWNKLHRRVLRKWWMKLPLRKSGSRNGC
jgi:glycosyl transferase family 25